MGHSTFVFVDKPSHTLDYLTMDKFEYQHGELFCEQVPVEKIAAITGTPVYIYSAQTLRLHYGRLAQAFAPLDPVICFSVKSLSNIHVLELLAREGAGFDVVSGGELYRVAQAGGAKVVFAGVGKTDAEIRFALTSGIGYFNVESEEEFENLALQAVETSTVAHAALRVNPDVDPKTHRYIATGKKETKFGVDLERAVAFFQAYGRDERVRLDALHMHIGSSIYSPGPYVEAISKTLDLIARLRGMGFEVNALDIGGGFGADYGKVDAPSAADFAADIVPLLTGKGLRIIMEPGRQISCNAGILVARVLYVKVGGEKRFVIADAAMNDLIRPALYDGTHFIYPVRTDRPPQRRLDWAPDNAVGVDVVGGICESSDFLAKDRQLPPLKRGDLLAVFAAGAYGFVMASQYNSRPRAPEVLVDGDDWKIIRRRENYEDLLRPEREI